MTTDFAIAVGRNPRQGLTARRVAPIKMYTRDFAVTAPPRTCEHPVAQDEWGPRCFLDSLALELTETGGAVIPSRRTSGDTPAPDPVMGFSATVGRERERESERGVQLSDRRGGRERAIKIGFFVVLFLIRARKNKTLVAKTRPLKTTPSSILRTL